jgi:hypothetical protein
MDYPVEPELFMIVLILHSFYNALFIYAPGNPECLTIKEMKTGTLGL